ncbi:RRM domain-containing protein [Balamuthia mandrillaris]
MSTKVFVGNLSFQTTGEQLREQFVSFGDVTSANIITRGPRSLGYGFVEFSSEEAANKAVSAMDQQTLDGRVVNVQIARPQVKKEKAEKEGEEGESSSQEGGKRRPGARRRRTQSGASGSPSTDGNAPGARRGGPRRRFRPRGEKSGEGAATSTGNAEEGNKPGQRRGGGAPRSRTSSTTNGSGARRPRKNVPRKPREASTTTLFVGNLPFSMEDQGLLELFSAHSPVKATIARKASNRSKGFGFVEFATEEAQKAALEAMKDQQVEGRELNLKIALQPVEKEEGEAGPSGEAGQSSSGQEAAAKEDAPAAEKTEETKSEASESSAAQ